MIITIEHEQMDNLTTRSNVAEQRPPQIQKDQSGRTLQIGGGPGSGDGVRAKELGVHTPIRGEPCPAQT